MEWIAEFGVGISDRKVKTSETEREWKMGETSETPETPEKRKVGKENGLWNLVHNTITSRPSGIIYLICPSLHFLPFGSHLQCPGVSYTTSQLTGIVKPLS